MTRSLLVAGVQPDLVWEDRAANHAMAQREVARAVAAGARLVVLPEMFATGFSMDTEVTAEAPDGPTATLLVDLAARHDAWVAGSFACAPDRDHDNDDGRPTNRLLVAGPDGVAGHYDKVHPFSHAGEDNYYRAGDRAAIVVVDDVRVGLTVCYDLRFANLYWELGPDVDLFLVPANWPCARREHWRTLLVARAIENQAFVLGANRVGTGRRLDGDNLAYCGDSMLVDPLGRVASSAATDPNIVFGHVDPDEVTRVRDRFRFLADRRQR